MPYTEFGFGPDATVSAGSQATRINNGRDEVNANNGNEGGIRFQEDGVELWFTASDTAAINKGVSQLRTDDFNGVSGSLYAQTSNQTAQNFPGGANDPALQAPPGDIYKLAPVDPEGRFQGTDAEPIELEFGTGLGVWEITAYKPDGSTVTINVGNDLREQDTLGDGVEPAGPGDPFWNWLDSWGPETVTFPAGVYTHFTFESLTPQLVLDKSPTFQLDSLSADYFCFLEGTLIDTPSGPRQVETLSPGDLVLAADGRTMPVVWLGMQRIATPVVAKGAVNPICIRAHALSKGVPRRDLYVSPDHAIFIDGMLVNASALINGTTVTQVDQMPLTGFTYYHVETEAHEVILAEGCPAETFVDVVSRRDFDNYDDYRARMGLDRIIPAMNCPRVSARRLLPASIKARLGISGDHPLGATSAEGEAA